MTTRMYRSWSCTPEMEDLRPAPHAEEEEISFIDGVEDESPSQSDVSQRMSVSMCSSVLTADSGKASSTSTLKSPDKSAKTVKFFSKMVVCRITLLDGSSFEPKGVDKNSNGQSVFDKVCRQLDLVETDYFGLTFRDKNGKKYWLDHSKKISKQVKGGTWVFEFQVKFYPPDPHSLKEDLTRYQLCLQLRVDIFNGKLPCSFVTYALLGSYTVQAEMGDFSQTENGSSIEYLKDFDFAPQQPPELLEKIAELHKHHKAQTPSEAESNFLENAKKLAMYGVDKHDAKDSDSTDMTLGVCASGILVYKDRLRINRFVWPKILKLSYKRNNFYVKIRPGESDPHEKVIGFRLESHKLAKRLWKTCVEHHAFFRLKMGDPVDTSTLFPRFNSKFRYSGRTQAQARKAAETVQREEPHIRRTAERKSMSKEDKAKSMDDMTNKHGGHGKGFDDENDMYDKKKGDPNATAGMGGYDDSAGYPHKDGQYQTVARPGDETEDRLDKSHGDKATMEGAPGYEGDQSGLAEGAVVAKKGKKDKKDKDDDKKKKRDGKKKKKGGDATTEDRADTMGPGGTAETNIDEHGPDSSELAHGGVHFKPGSTGESPEGGSPKDKGKGGKDKGKHRGKGKDKDKGKHKGKDKNENENDEGKDPEVSKAYLELKAGQGYDGDGMGKEGEGYGRDGHGGDGHGGDGHGGDGHGGDGHGREGDMDREGYDKDGKGKHGEFEGYDIDVKIKNGEGLGSDGEGKDGKGKDKDGEGKDGKGKDKDGKGKDKHGKGKDKDGKGKDKDGKGKDKDGKGKDKDGKGKDKDKDDKGSSFKKDRFGSGIFGKFGKKSPHKDKDPHSGDAQQEDGTNVKGTDPSATAGYPDNSLQKTKVGMSWALPGMKELMEKKAAANQAAEKCEKSGSEQSLDKDKAGEECTELEEPVPIVPEGEIVFSKATTQEAGMGYGPDFAPGDFGMQAGDSKSIDRKMQFIPVTPPTYVEGRDRNRSTNGVDEPMSFFQHAGESDDSSLGRKKPPPVAKKPKGGFGYDSEEDRHLRDVPPTVATESYQYNPDTDDMPTATSNIPIVETKTHHVTYEKDGVPVETEDGFLISAQSVTTKTQTIETTTFKTERDGLMETRVERKITVTSDENDETDHDALLRSAIEEVTAMNPDLTVERIECMRQIEEINGEK